MDGYVVAKYSKFVGDNDADPAGQAVIVEVTDREEGEVELAFRRGKTHEYYRFNEAELLNALEQRNPST
jgi:hypothetical protein